MGGGAEMQHIGEGIFFFSSNINYIYIYTPIEKKTCVQRVSNSFCCVCAYRVINLFWYSADEKIPSLPEFRMNVVSGHISMYYKCVCVVCVCVCVVCVCVCAR